MKSELNHIQNWLELGQKAKWSASSLARECNVSLRTLQRFFLKHMGKSPKAWLSEQRRGQAIALKREGHSVKMAAYLLGYTHANNLSRDLKKTAKPSLQTRTALRNYAPEVN